MFARYRESDWKLFSGLEAGDRLSSNVDSLTVTVILLVRDGTADAWAYAVCSRMQIVSRGQAV